MPDHPEIDFLQEKYQLSARVAKPKKPGKLRTLAVFLSLLILAGVLFSYQISRTQSPNAAGTGLSFLSSLRGLITSDSNELVGEDDDRINILLLGIGGAGHEGAELTDTIIVASLRPSTSEVAMMSIPRDLAVDIPGYGYTKINAANAYGERDNPGSGPELTKQIVSEIIEQEIHYYVKVDFDSFEELIDAVGGIDVHVDTAFSDSLYPTDDYLYQTVSFKQGWTTMSGDRALKFSRSRHGNNGEGSDFARAARQQKVIVAAKEKILSPAVLLNPAKLNKMVNLFADNVETNLTVWEMIRLSGHAPSIETTSIKTVVLDSSPSGPLFNSTIGAAFVLKPKVSDWSEVQAIAESIFEAEAPSAQAPTTPIFQAQLEAIESSASIIVQNGTATSGLASNAATLLQGSGFTVLAVENADAQTYTETVIIDFTGGSKSAELQALATYFDAQTSTTIEGWITQTTVSPAPQVTPGELAPSQETDFLLILGENAEYLLL